MSNEVFRKPSSIPRTCHRSNTSKDNKEILSPFSLENETDKPGEAEDNNGPLFFPNHILQTHLNIMVEKTAKLAKLTELEEYGAKYSYLRSKRY